MAGDLQMTLSGASAMKVKCKTKVYRFDPHELHYPTEPFLIGFCGTMSEIIDVVDYYTRPDYHKRVPRTRNLSGLVLTKSGKIFQFDSPGNWLAMSGGFAAVGSGAQAALGALQVGASPKEAVNAASKIDPYTGMGISLHKV